MKTSYSPTVDDFTKLVDKHQYKFCDLDQIYLRAIRRCNKGFGKMTEFELYLVLNSYLLDWGRMGRVLGKKGCRRIAEKLRTIDLTKYQNLTLEADINNERLKAVEKVFNELLNTKWVSEKGRTKRVGPTAAAKGLHLVAPDFFMIWDREVRKVYGFGEDGAEYVRFLLNMQSWLKTLGPVVQERSDNWGKSCTKVIDAYNWMKCWSDKKGLRVEMLRTD